MGFLLVISLLVSAASVLAAPGTIVPRPSRISGGTPVEVRDYSYMASLFYYYPNANIFIQRCTGTIVSSFHVLSTAYCFESAIMENMQVRAGSTYSTSGGVLVPLQDVKFHPDYVMSPRKADIAILFLSTPLGMSDTISTLFIPPQDITLPDNYPVDLVAWGFETENGPQLEFLKKAMLNLINHDTCRERLAEADFEVAEVGTVCAGVLDAPGVGPGACAGDWGAPIVIGGVVVGLVSHYHECGNSYYPDVLTRVDRYSDWILEVAAS